MAIDKAPWERDSTCVISSFGIPLPVVAFEAALLFGLFQVSVRLLQKDKRTWWRTPAATAGLCALLMVNVFAVLDPVVSTARWCDPDVTNPVVSQYLPFGLWTWFTTDTHPGYWFGVPPINYVAWFLAAAFFGFLARWDDESNAGFIKKGGPIRIIWGTLALTGIYLGTAIGAKVFLDRWLVHGQEYLFTSNVFPERAWQLGVVAFLLFVALGLLSCGRRQRQWQPTFEAVTVVPKLGAFAFCFWLLVRHPHFGIFVIFFLTLAIALIALKWPAFANRFYRDEPLRGGPEAGSSLPKHDPEGTGGVGV
jgi:hypothetical protein